ncbi:MAG TPA: adenylate/guanylate cyclase domain-containing protein [Vicinamibacterales bacterium]|nr:adenylate/guanylate cyclase domain-containing protein [Vicinamibacterales bacterium]
MRKMIAGLAIGIGASALVAILAWPGWLERWEMQTYDWRVRTLADLRIARGQPLVHPDIVLVEITDASMRDMAELVGRWPWPRAVHGMLIDYIARGKPKAIAVDLTFLENERESTYKFGDGQMTSADSDAALADAVRRAGNVIVLADAVDAGLVGGEVDQKAWAAPPYRLGPAIEERPLITLPYPALAAASAAFGHNFIALDPDGPARRFPPFVRKGDRYMPLLGVAAALTGGGFQPEDVSLESGAIRIRDRRIPLVPVTVTDVNDRAKTHAQQTMLINYRAPSLVAGKRPYPAYEAALVLKSLGQIEVGEKPEIPAEAFAGKIVFVGLNASGLVDVFQTPFGAGVMPGIQLHASIADSILSNRFIGPAPRWTATAATLAGAIAVGLMAAALSFWIAAGGSALLAMAWSAGALGAFDRGLWLSMASPLLAMAVALFAGTAYRYFVEDAEKRKVSRLFGRYVSRDVYKQLLANPALAELGGARREMSVLFSDLRGFTTITEKGNPEQLVQQLNEYFSRMVDVVFRNGGTVDKFVGDMVMALFGAPVDDVAHADAAVTSAVEMVRELGDLNRRWASEGKVQLDIGIGVNSGDMIAGNIGSSAIMSYTVIGDNVNLGARLESLNKDYRSRIIISDATRSRLRKSYELRPLGGVVVKGKTQPVEIYAVLAPSPLVPLEVEQRLNPAAAEGKTV